MKLESQITNNHSSLIYNQSKRRSTPVENVRQIHPFYAKQSQCQVRQNQPKHFCNNEIRAIGHLVIQTNKAKNKANLTQNKPNSNPIKPKTNPIQSQFVLQRTGFIKQTFLLQYQKIVYKILLARKEKS